MMVPVSVVRRIWLLLDGAFYYIACYSIVEVELFSAYLGKSCMHVS